MIKREKTRKNPKKWRLASLAASGGGGSAALGRGVVPPTPPIGDAWLILTMYLKRLWKQRRSLECTLVWGTWWKIRSWHTLFISNKIIFKTTDSSTSGTYLSTNTTTQMTRIFVSFHSRSVWWQDWPQNYISTERKLWSTEGNRFCHSRRRTPYSSSLRSPNCILPSSYLKLWLNWRWARTGPPRTTSTSTSRSSR